MLAGFQFKHCEWIEEACRRHPLLSFVIGQFLISVGMIAAVTLIACLGAIPVYFLTNLL